MAKYECNYCGKQYDSPVERARCEIECAEKIERNQEEERKKKLEAEKSERLKKICAIFDTLNDEIEAYNKDYNERMCLKLPPDIENIICHMMW